MKQRSPIIYIYNGLEHEWNFIKTITESVKRKQAIRASHHQADTYLFTNPNTTCIYISPIAIDQEFITYVEQLLRSTFYVIVPEEKTYSICSNVVHDSAALASVLRLISNKKQIDIKSYASTPELYDLVTTLNKHNIDTTLLDTVENKNLDVVSYYGSKSGFRQAFAQFMPHGVVCNHSDEALNEAEKIHKTCDGVVVKTDKGCAGEGVLIFKKSTPFTQVRKELVRAFATQSYWNQFPITVEAYIPPSLVESPFPSIEGYINSKKELSFPYYCNMIVTPEGEFYGVEIHEDVVKGAVRSEMLRISHCIGNVYAQAGYRGTFDIDFLYDGSRVYANESNMRTNGGTDTFITTKTLIGSHFFSERYVLSNFIEFPQTMKHTFASMHLLLKDEMYDPKTKTGIVIGSSRALELHGLSLIIIAKDSTQAHRIQARIARTLHSKTILTNCKNQE